jgi:hypothetical protein
MRQSFPQNARAFKQMRFGHRDIKEIIMMLI